MISHDLQTGLLVLNAKDLPASRCSQVREKVEHHKEEMCKEHVFCQSKIITDQGTSLQKTNKQPNPPPTKKTQTKAKNPV